ncbi:MAG: membrane protein insertase YidC, partial [Gammaproteobacteria bacterium]
MQTQTQRMILWIIFSMSLLFLWDSWQRYNGQPSFFGSTPATQTQTHAQNPQAPTPAPATAPADRTIPPSSVPAPAPAAGQAPSGARTAASSPPIRLANDVLALDVDPAGGQVRRAELLKYRDVVADDGHNFVLLQDTASTVYLAQSGFVGAPDDASFPTHRTPLAPADGNTAARVLAPGADSVSLTLTGESGGLKLERTYTLERGAYVVQVHDKITNVSDAPLQPTLYMQLTRDGDAPPGGSRFYSTYTGPAIYTEADKFQKVSFSDIEKGKAKHTTTADNGWAGIIEHYFVSAWIPREGATREFYTRKVGENLYSVGEKEPLPELAPGASTTVESQLLIGPQDQNMLDSIAPGLDLTVDYGWLTVVAKPIYWLLEKLHGLVGNW